MQQVKTEVQVDTIFAGKFRRYHNLSVWKQLLRFKTIVLPNIRDSVYILMGTIQSLIKLVLWRPDVVFCKGGYVCLPVGLAAQVLRIPVVLHDSDVHPGLANRVLARWAVKIATGAPSEHYTYPTEKMHYIGIPVKESYKRYTVDEQNAFKSELGFDPRRPLIVITGGGLGADAINEATVSIYQELLAFADVVLLSGSKQYAQLQKKLADVDDAHFKLYDFIQGDLITHTLAAADVVVTRAGATTLNELAALAKPTIIIPSPYLTGGHQLKNAKMYEDHGAAVVINEKELLARPHELLDTLTALVLNPKTLETMSNAIHVFAKPDAATDMAAIVVAAADKQ